MLEKNNDILKAIKECAHGDKLFKKEYKYQMDHFEKPGFKLFKDKDLVKTLVNRRKKFEEEKPYYDKLKAFDSDSSSNKPGISFFYHMESGSDSNIIPMIRLLANPLLILLLKQEGRNGCSMLIRKDDDVFVMTGCVNTIVSSGKIITDSSFYTPI